MSGDSTTFAGLWIRYHSGISGWLYLQCRDAVEAEDLTSETFTKAWRNWAGFQDRGEATTRGWLFTIARRLWIDRVTSPDYRLRAATSTVPDEQVVEDFADALVDGIVARAQLAEAMTHLVPRHRLALGLRYVADWPAERVAEAVAAPGDSESVGKAVQFRARRALATAMGGRP